MVTIMRAFFAREPPVSRFLSPDACPLRVAVSRIGGLDGRRDGLVGG
ncbi:hypothetical protein [Herbiconiux sp. UC225_62]